MRILTLLSACLFTLSLSGQTLERSVIGSAGTRLTGSAGSLQFTVGEVAVTRTDNQLSLARGFHRAKAGLISTSLWSAPDVDLQLAAYPNPTSGDLTLEGMWETNDRMVITNILGRRLQDRTLTPRTALVDLSAYPAGTYLLTITRAGRPLRTLRVVRR